MGSILSRAYNGCLLKPVAQNHQYGIFLLQYCVKKYLVCTRRRAVSFNLGSSNSLHGSMRLLKLALFWVSRFHQILNNVSQDEFETFIWINLTQSVNKKLFPPGIEPGTICVLGRCDNHYTTVTWMIHLPTISSTNCKILHTLF